MNHGAFGDNIEPVPDSRLSLQSRRIYRFFRLLPNKIYRSLGEPNMLEHVRPRADGSPQP